MGAITEKRRRDYSGLDADKASIPAGGKAVNDTFLATDTKILYFWDGVAWIIIPLDVIVAGMIKTDAVETLKIKNLNVTTAKAALGFGRYVARNVAAVDFDKDDFTKDLAWHVNGLDLSGILPAGTVAAIITISLKTNTAGTIMRLRRDAADYDTLHEVVMPVANQDTTDTLTIPVSADRLLDYMASNVTWATLDLTVVGYFM